MGAIYVMWKRQIIRFTRARARIFISLFQPVLFLIAFGFGFSSMFQAAGEGDYISFLAPGIVAMSILFGSVMNGAETIWDKQFGFLKETLVAPVPRWKIMLGRTLGGATVASVQGILVLIITMFMGFRFLSFLNFVFAILVMFLIAMLFNALGIAIASRFDDMSAFPMIMNLLIIPMFFLSGALFKLQDLPTWLRFLISFNPMVYAVDVLRGLLAGIYLNGLFFDMLVLIPLTIFMILIGAYSFSKIEV